MIKYILFDLDGTLTDSKEGITKCVSYALLRFGIERRPEELTSFVGPPLKEQFMKYASLSEEDGKKAVEVYRERFSTVGIFENRLYEGILPMLDELKKSGMVLAVATSKPQVFAERIGEKYGIAPYMQCIVGSRLDGTLTDKAQVIKKTMEMLGAEPDNTLMVGDREHDCIGAHKNGIACIGAKYGYPEEGELENAGAERIARTVEELKSILISYK